MIRALSCEQLNEKSKAKQITAQFKLLLSSKLHGLFCTGKNLAAVFSSVQSSNSSGRVIIVNIYTTVVKMLHGESFSDHSAVKQMLNLLKNYFRQELLYWTLDVEFRQGLVCTAAGLHFLSPALKLHPQKTHFQ